MSLPPDERPAPTADDAAALTHAVREIMGRRSAHRGDWPATVHVESVTTEVRQGLLVLDICYSDTARPGLGLGTAFTVGGMFWIDGALDAGWAAEFATTYFGEATFAGDPARWDTGQEGVHWYRDTLP